VNTFVLGGKTGLDVGTVDAGLTGRKILDIENSTPGTGLAKADQGIGDDVARPGPGADFLYREVIDVDQKDVRPFGRRRFDAEKGIIEAEFGGFTRAGKGQAQKKEKYQEGGDILEFLLEKISDFPGCIHVRSPEIC